MTPNTQPKLLSFKNYTFRCSGLGNIMGESKELSPKEKYEEIENKIAELEAQQSNAKTQGKQYEARSEKLLQLKEELKNLEPYKTIKKRPLPQTCISYLVQCYVEARYGVKKDIYSKYFEKGKACEDEAIDLLGELHDKPYMKCVEPRKFNDYIEGECDVKYIEAQLRRIIDIKNSWDVFTYQKRTLEEIDSNYDWQGVGYLELYDCDEFVLAFALMNMPYDLFLDECKRILYEYGSNMAESEEYKNACAEFKKKCTFDHIPLRERFFELSVKRDDSKYQRVVERVIECREWLDDYAKSEFIRVYGLEMYNQVCKNDVQEDTVPNGFLELREVEKLPVSIVKPPVAIDINGNSTITVVKNEEIIENVENNVNSEAQKHEVINETIPSLSEDEQWSDEPLEEDVLNNLKPFINACTTVNELQDLSLKYSESLIKYQSVRHEFSNHQKKLETLTKENLNVGEYKEPNPVKTVSDKIKDLLQLVENCKTEQDTRDLYKLKLNEYNTIPEFKTALSAKRDSFKATQTAPPPPKPATPPPPPSSKPTPPPPAQQAAPKPEVPKVNVETENKINELKTLAETCQTLEELKSKVTRPNQTFIVANKELLAYLQSKGVELDKKDKEKAASK